MNKETLETSNSEENSSSWWWLLAAGALVGLSFSAASDSAKRGVRERAGGKCESCGIKIGNKGIVGHLDHTKILEKNGHRSNRYNTLNNLRFHCPFCEAAWHVQHIGRAKDIGLSEKNNNSSSIGTLVSLYLNSKRKFWRLYDRYPELIDKLYADLGKELPSR